MMTLPSVSLSWSKVRLRIQYIHVQLASPLPLYLLSMDCWTWAGLSVGMPSGLMKWSKRWWRLLGEGWLVTGRRMRQVRREDHIMIDRNTSLGQDTAADFFPEMPSSWTFALRILQFLQVNTCSWAGGRKVCAWLMGTTTEDFYMQIFIAFDDIHRRTAILAAPFGGIDCTALYVHEMEKEAWTLVHVYLTTPSATNTYADARNHKEPIPS